MLLVKSHLGYVPRFATFEKVHLDASGQIGPQLAFELTETALISV
jgi:hypothetical protein